MMGMPPGLAMMEEAVSAPPAQAIMSPQRKTFDRHIVEPGRKEGGRPCSLQSGPGLPVTCSRQSPDQRPWTPLLPPLLPLTIIVVADLLLAAPLTVRHRDAAHTGTSQHSGHTGFPRHRLCTPTAARYSVINGNFPLGRGRA